MPYRRQTCGGTLQITGAHTGDSIDYSKGKLADKATCTVAVKVTGNQIGEWKDVVQDLYSNEAAEPMPASATLTITKANQTINFPPLADRLTTAGSFEIKATASSKLLVTFAVVGVCSVVQGVMELTGQAGLCTVTAKQEGNDTYLPAPDVTNSFAVNEPAKLEQTITFAPLGNKTVDDAPFGAFAQSSSQLPITFAASGVCGVTDAYQWSAAWVVGVILTGEPGTCTITASQPGNEEYNAAADVAQTYNVLAATATPEPTSIPPNEPTAPASYQVYLPLVTQ